MTGLNTDTALWRKSEDAFSPRIHVTEWGDIGINVGGYVLVAPVEAWHKAGIKAFTVKEPKRHWWEKL